MPRGRRKGGWRCVTCLERTVVLVSGVGQVGGNGEYSKVRHNVTAKPERKKNYLQRNLRFYGDKRNRKIKRAEKGEQKL